MKNFKMVTTGILSMMMATLTAADYTVKGNFVTIPVKEVKAGGAKVVRLQVINDNIIRVQATSESALPQKQSLMIVEQKAQPIFDVKEDDDKVCVKAKNVEARVDTESGKITFYDVILEGEDRFTRFIELLLSNMQKTVYVTGDMMYIHIDYTKKVVGVSLRDCDYVDETYKKRIFSAMYNNPSVILLKSTSGFVSPLSILN